MARVVILEAGTAGNTAALHLPRMLNKKHRVGVGKMTIDIANVPRPTQQTLRLPQNSLF